MNHGQAFPPDGTLLTIITDWCDYTAQKLNGNEIGGDLADWYEDEPARAGDVVCIRYDESAPLRCGGVQIHISFMKHSTDSNQQALATSHGPNGIDEIWRETSDATAVGSANVASIAHEVVQVVAEQGALTKRDILETWALPECYYSELQTQVLELETSIEKGPRKVGGFRMTQSRGCLPEKDVGDRVLLRDGWEREAADRLSELLSYTELEHLVGSLQQIIRQTRKVETGEDRRGTKAEFAAALMLRHGRDILAESDIRKVVALACKTPYVGRWHPGKDAARDFARRAGLPSELAGIPATDRPPAYEHLDGTPILEDLLPFQKEVKNKLRRKLNTPGAKAILTLPTGAGKTRVAVECIRDWLTDEHGIASGPMGKTAVLWLAHTQELCEQAYTCFKDVWESSHNVCPLLLVRFWGHYTKDLCRNPEVLKDIVDKPSVLVSTPQRIVNLLEERESGVLQDIESSLGLLLIDEAHRAAAPSYRKIFRALLSDKNLAVTVGLTATPFRMEYLLEDPDAGTRDLKDIFENIIEPTETLGSEPRERLERLQEMQVLAMEDMRDIDTSTVVRVPNGFDENLISAEDAERLDRILAKKVDNSIRRLKVLEHILAIARDPANSVLYFGPSVRDAECMTYLLRRHHIAAEVVHGETRDATRRRVIREFKDNRIRVLCNCQVLTTGFDAPKVTHIVIARPTVSQVLYEQMIGRGLRGPKFGGTSTCVILNCIDDFQGCHVRLGYDEYRRVWGSKKESTQVLECSRC